MRVVVRRRVLITVVVAVSLVGVGLSARQAAADPSTPTTSATSPASSPPTTSATSPASSTPTTSSTTVPGPSGTTATPSATASTSASATVTEPPSPSIDTGDRPRPTGSSSSSTQLDSGVADRLADGYVKPTFSDAVYLIHDSVASYVTWAQFVAAGYPPVTVVPTIPGTDYYKVQGRDTVFAVLPGGLPCPLTYEQWQLMGGPQPTLVAAVPNLTIVKVPETPSLWLVGPDRSGRKLDYAEWTMLGQPGYVVVSVIPGSTIVKVPEWDTLWAIAPDDTPRALDMAGWGSVGYPLPATVIAIPGSWFSRTSEAPTIWAVAPNGNWRALSAADYRALGGPSFQLSNWSSSQNDVSASELWASYRSGCPVGPGSLARLQIWYWGFDGQLHQGDVVLARAVVGPVEATFHAAFNSRFPFRDVSPVDKYYGDDVMSMSADNTSAFNCRTVTGNPRQLSQHSYGNAIDYDTFENPYVTAAQVFPAGSETYLNRGWLRPGMIQSGDAIAGMMAAYGWPWGARWANPDYQHFSSNGG